MMSLHIHDKQTCSSHATLTVRCVKSAGVDVVVVGCHGNGEDVLAEFLVMPGVALHSLAVDAGQRHLVYDNLHYLEVKRQMHLTPVISHSTAQSVAASTIIHQHNNKYIIIHNNK